MTIALSSTLSSTLGSTLGSTLTTTLAVVAGLVALASALLLRPRTVSAHCDTMAGPTVKDGELALRTGSVNIALKWVRSEDEAEVGRIFAQARAVRDLSEEARMVADQWFLENLVRIHRAGEGAPDTGIAPEGAAVDERVRAADEAVAAGTLAPLTGLVPDEQLPELERRFAEVLARSEFPVDDVEAGRSYLEAYVSFFKLAEGHDHADHAHEHGHVHEHA